MDIPVGSFSLHTSQSFRADDTTIHAGWEVLLWLKGWKGEKDTKFEKFVAVSYPYYLYLDENGSYYDRPDISIKALDADADKAEKAYQAALIELSVYAAPNNGLDFVAEYQKKTADWKKQPEKKREYMNGLIVSWWGMLSDVKPSQGPYCMLCHPCSFVFANCPSKRARRIKSFTFRCPLTEGAIQRMSRNKSGVTFHTQESLQA
jgi:hypothetical protein